jgi:methyltransferase (TIGR00027 family)
MTLHPVSLTAFYCCGVRMQDAERPHPVCGDQYAKVFMSETGRGVFARFRREIMPNGTNVTRHRIIDDLLRAQLLEDPARPVLLIGAGFDSRAFRLRGGRWTEVDEAALIRYKEERLPAGQCPNPLERVAVDFATDWLPGVAERYRGAARMTVVLEGVLMYLEEARIARLLETLRRRLPRHELICDLMSRRFFDRHAQRLHREFEQLGATFRYLSDHPEAPFLEAGYRLVERQSVVHRAAALKAIPLPALLVRYALRTLRRGYVVCQFESGG